MSILQKLFRPVPPPAFSDQPAPASLVRIQGLDGSDGEHAHLPLVTIITVVLNGRETLGRTLASVARLSYPRIEHILIDGGSTDGTVGIIRASSQISAWSSEPDTGIYDAMNKGVAAARGQYIAMLNADDWYEPQMIECAVQSLRTSGRGFVFGDLAYYTPISGKRVRRAGDPDYTRSLPGKVPATWHPTMVCNRKIFETIGLFRTDLEIAADLDWQVRAFTHGFRGIYDPRVVTHHWGGGISSTNQRLAIAEGFVSAITNGARSPDVLRYWFVRYFRIRFPGVIRIIRKALQRWGSLKKWTAKKLLSTKSRLPFKPQIKRIVGVLPFPKPSSTQPKPTATHIQASTPKAQSKLLAFAAARDECGTLTDSAIELLIARAPSWSSVYINDPDNQASGIRTLLQHLGIELKVLSDHDAPGRLAKQIDLVIAPDWDLDRATQSGARECIITDDGPYDTRVPLQHDGESRGSVISLCCCRPGA